MSFRRGKKIFIELCFAVKYRNIAKKKKIVLNTLELHLLTWTKKYLRHATINNFENIQLSIDNTIIVFSSHRVRFKFECKEKIETEIMTISTVCLECLHLHQQVDSWRINYSEGIYVRFR